MLARKVLMMLFSTCTRTSLLQAYPPVNLTCMKTYGVPQGWFSVPAATPSALWALSISLIETGDPRRGPSELRLNISWAINIDKSNFCLSGTWIEVNEDAFRCEYQPPFAGLDTSGYDQLWFHFTDFVAEPDMDYTVSGLNLPPPMMGSESVTKILQFQTSDCHTEKMKFYESCIKKGSLWEPNITAVFLNNQVQVNFTSSQYSTYYHILLWRPGDPEVKVISEKVCHTRGDESRWSETLSSTRPCESLEIVVQPHFDTNNGCCIQASVNVSCTTTKPPGTDDSSHSASFWLGVCSAAGVLFLLLACVSILCKVHSAYLQIPKLSEDRSLVSVLIVYPAKSRAFQRAVVTLAEFLMSHCCCRVVIDVWQRRSVAEQGLLCWLTEQIESVDKVIFVTAQGCSVTGLGPSSGLTDFTVPSSVDDIFILALNIFASRAQEPHGRSKYLNVHLGTHLKGLPVALSMCRSFSLMTDLDELRWQLHGKAPGWMYNLPLIGSRLEMLQGHDKTAKLRDAIKELQMWEDDV